MELHEDEKKFLEKIDSGRGVLLGWPLLCIDGKDGKRVLPIFQAEIDVAASLEKGRIELTSQEWRTCDLLNATSQIEESDVEAMQEVISSLGAKKGVSLLNKLEKALKETFPKWDSSKSTDIGKLNIGEMSNLTLILVGAESQFSQTLVNELRQISMRTDWKNTAAAKLFNPNSPRVADTPEVVAPLALNESQEEAIGKLSTNSVVVVTGPPGTGKSQVISALVSQSWLVEKSVLVTSVNNAAVDVAVARIKELDPALVLRTGNKASREALSQEIESFIERAGNIRFTSRDAQREIEQTRRRFYSTYRNRKDRMKKYRTYLYLQGRLALLSEDLISLNYKLWGQGTARAESGIGILTFIANQLSKEKNGPSLWTKLLRNYSQKKYFLDEYELEDLQEWLTLRKEFTKKKKSLDGMSDSCITEHRMKLLDEEWREESKILLTALVRAKLQKNKTAMSGLRTAVLKGQYQAAISASNLKIFPAWAVTAYSAATAIPLTPQHLDLVVIDEASQCSIAATFPLAYRAKQLLILGDLNQLRPIIKLNEVDEKNLATKRSLDIEYLRAKRLDHRTSSAFGAFDHSVSAESKVLLDEHYRSHSSISHWFNANFYAGNLTLLGSRPTKGLIQGIHWQDIYGKWERGERGSYLNIAECEQVVRNVTDHAHLNLSIGVVTPYARQAQEIRDRLSSILTEEQLHNIEFVSSTAHRFQGGEKDLIIYSTVITPETPQRSADWIKKNRELINVAVSRARETLIVVGNPDAPAALGIGDLVSLKSASMMDSDSNGGGDLAQTKAETALYEALLKQNIASAPQLPISGVIVDFAIPLKNSEGLAIEVDGEVHEDANGIRVRQDFQRDAMLRDLGWKVMRIPNWRVFHEIDAVIAEIESEMSESSLLSGAEISFVQSEV
jgi:very-short-patch-repair endonuclease